MVTTPERTREQRFLERQAWIDAVQRRRDLTPAARLIGGRLGWHKNLITNQCNPGYGTLGDECGYPTRTAIRAIAELEQKGCIKVKRTSGGARSNSYTLIKQPETSVTTARVTRAPTSDKRRTGPVSPQHPNLEKNLGASKEAPKGEREIELALDDLDPGGAAALTGAPAEEDQDPHGGRFEDLQAVWRRGWVSDNTPKGLAITRQAFELARQEAAPELIIEAARGWVAAADAPRFLPPLAQWLATRGWEKVPPPKARRTAAAAPKGRHRTTNGRKVDCGRLAMMHVGYIEAADGSLVWGGAQ